MASFRIVPRLQKPAFEVGALPRLVQGGSLLEVDGDSRFDPGRRLLEINLPPPEQSNCPLTATAASQGGAAMPTIAALVGITVQRGADSPWQPVKQEPYNGAA